MVLYHRRNINEMTGYTPFDVVKSIEKGGHKDLHFGTSQYDEDGSIRNYSSQFENVEPGQIVVLEYVDSRGSSLENLEYRGIWGITLIEDVRASDNSKRGLNVNFSVKDLVLINNPAEFDFEFPIPDRVSLMHLRLTDEQQKKLIEELRKKTSDKNIKRIIERI